MKLSVKREDREQDENVVYDLMCGIGPKQIRILCENPNRGGYGYSPLQVAEFTLDMIFMLLTDDKMLRSSKKERTQIVAPEGVARDKDGFVRGRDRKGNPIRGRITGKSKVQMLREEAEAARKRKRRKRKRGN